MANRKKNSRCSNWSHEGTMVLTELKKDAFFKKEGRLVWEHIAQTISSRFPDHKRSPDQCRRRWETLTKTYKHIEEYCMETGQDHWQLDEDELSSMKLDTAYRQDWYDIVKQVCSQRKRKEKGDCDLIAAKRIKRSGTCSSPSSVLPECTPGRESLYVTAGQVTATIVSGQISTRPSLEAEEEIQRLHTILKEKDALILEMERRRQHEQFAQQDQVTHNSPAVVTANGKEPLQHAILDYHGVTVEHSSKAAEQHGIGCELMVTRSRSLSPKSFSDGLLSEAMNLAGDNDLFDSSTDFLPELWDSLCTWGIEIRLTYLFRGFLRIASAGGRRGQGCSTSTYQRTRKGKERNGLSYWPGPETHTCRGTCTLHPRQKRIQVAWMVISHGYAETEPDSHHC